MGCDGRNNFNVVAFCASVCVVMTLMILPHTDGYRYGGGGGGGGGDTLRSRSLKRLGFLPDDDDDDGNALKNANAVIKVRHMGTMRRRACVCV